MVKRMPHELLDCYLTVEENLTALNKQGAGICKEQGETNGNSWTRWAGASEGYIMTAADGEKLGIINTRLGWVAIGERGMAVAKNLKVVEAEYNALASR